MLSRKHRYALLAIPFALLLCLFATAKWFISSSQTAPGGTHLISSLEAPVQIEEDSSGVPTITAKSEADVLRAQGWLLARDRLFQMDLIRRRSAGQLAEIFGSGALPSDREHRIYGFMRLADRVVANLAPDARKRLEYFSEGVNAYLRTGKRSLEMRIVGYTPAAWSPAATVLVALSMFEPPPSDAALTTFSSLQPPSVVSFFDQQFGFLDAPILADTKTPPLPTAPDEKTINLRKLSAGSREVGRERTEKPDSGSNAWAIAGSRTKSGKPLLASDPHLYLGLPNVWYRMRLKCPGLDVLGVAIPGVPGILIGSNAQIAWGFTNGMTDTYDRVVLSRGNTDQEYLVDGKSTPFTEHLETIAVKDAPPIVEVVRETIWGPVNRNTTGEPYAMQWVALDPTNFTRLEMLGLNAANDIPSAFKALEAWGGPVHNVLIASQDGHIGWTIVGHIPLRQGFDGSISQPRDKNHFWKGYLPQSRYPKVIDPPSGFLVSANQRSIPFGPEAKLLSTDWPSPARAYRIHKQLESNQEWTAQSAYELQLDTYSVVHVWYRDALVKAIDASPTQDPWLAAIRTTLEKWDGRASIESAAFPVIKAFRDRLFRVFLSPTLREVASGQERDEMLDRLSHDEWLVALLRDRPMHFLPSVYADYDTALRSVATEAAKSFVSAPEKLAGLRWGDSNRATVRHPFSLILPNSLGFLVNAPELPLPGSSLVPRVGNPSNGASMRLVVDLGDPKASIFTQPGGQSGHLFSAHYRDQFSTWIEGKTAPFEPGLKVAVTTLVSSPQSR